MLSKKAYDKAHRDYPLLKYYHNKPEVCNHNFCFVVYCNGKKDIVRCPKCGAEKEVPCTFDEDYD